jgi:serralysin
VSFPPVAGSSLGDFTIPPDCLPLRESAARTDIAYAPLYLNADAREGAVVAGKPSLTIDQAAAQLTRDGDGWSSGGSTVVTYAYRADAPSKMPEDTAGFSRFSAAQINQAELALRAWSDVANVTFARVGAGVDGSAAYSNSATILLGNYDNGFAGSAAFAYHPGVRATSSADGDVWVNVSLDYNAQPQMQGYGGYVLVHELGHAIGLSHPSDYDSAQGVALYVTDATYFEDSRQYTVMSYFSGTSTGAALPGYSAAPLLDDIAAAQRLYGANLGTRSDDTVYGFHSNADRPWLSVTNQSTKFLAAIWDGGGRDTLDFSGYSDAQTIDLRPGYFSDVGGNTGNLAIARGVDIENAVGGSGADTLIGNELGNVLSGNGGGGTILAGAGGDTLSERSGSSYLRGEEGDDSISGGSGFDDINGNQGADTASGGAGADWVVGGKDGDLLMGDAGDDVVLGNLGADTLWGGDGADTVRGGQDGDQISGGLGSDWLSGDRGDDTLAGGAGADVFHSFAGCDLDVIIDFSFAEGDRVLLDAGTTWRISTSGADTIVDLDGGGRVILLGVTGLSGDWIGV